jgi:hypothetical protein
MYTHPTPMIQMVAWVLVVLRKADVLGIHHPTKMSHRNYPSAGIGRERRVGNFDHGNWLIIEKHARRIAEPTDPTKEVVTSDQMERTFSKRRGSGDAENPNVERGRW